MKFINNCRKYGSQAVLAASVALATSPVFANDMVNAAKTELEGIKSGIGDFGVVVISISVAIVSVGIIKRLVNKA